MGKVNGITRKLVVFWQKLTGNYDEIPDWLLIAKERKASHLVIIWDSFEMEQFAMFAASDNDLKRIVEKYNSHPTTSVSKVIPIEY